MGCWGGDDSDERRKRVRDDSAPDSGVPGPPPFKHARSDSDDCDRFDSDGAASDPDESKIRDEILSILDEVEDFQPVVEDLDSVIRSFEEEILHPPPEALSGEIQPDLGYLLEASDDDLGLPPTDGKQWDDLPSHHSNEFQSELLSPEPLGFDLVQGDGFVDFPEAEIDFAEFLWRPESLPAI